MKQQILQKLRSNDHALTEVDLSKEEVDIPFLNDLLTALEKNPYVRTLKLNPAWQFDYATLQALVNLLNQNNRVSIENNCQAQAWIGRAFWFGFIVPVNEDLAKKYLGLAKAYQLTSLGQQYAQGLCYGIDCEKNDVEAVKCFMYAANELNDFMSQNALGKHYYHGEGVVQSDVKAREWYEKAAAQNHADAQYILGVIYYHGQGVAQDFTKAREWFEKAALQNDMEAQYMMGVIYYHDHGVAQDFAKAREWFEKAAAQNHVDAQSYLGCIYETGEGVAKNVAEAIKWFSLAAAQGDEEAEKKLIKLKAAATPVQQEPAWHFADYLPELASDMARQNGFALIPAAPEDIAKVITFYSHHPVPGMDLKRIEIIYNPEMNRSFAGKMKMLDERAHPAVNEKFMPTWDSENNHDWRNKVNEQCLEKAAPYTDMTYPNVKLIPMWHGTDNLNLEGLFRTGYANLATTDSGFFGKGCYSSHEAEYAYRVYSKGEQRPLVLNWVCFYSPYPVIDGDMHKLEGRANYKNYDAHFVPVVPATLKINETNYYPTKPNQPSKYTELVVFDSAQCLPRYLVELQPTLPNPPINLAGNPHTLFNIGKVEAMTYINLLAAAKYVYENYLNKPYTVGTINTDWRFTYGGQTVQRPNHGLAHTLRTVFYVPKIVECYIEHKNLTPPEAKNLRYAINEMQLALLFYVVGRKNEAGRHDNKNLFNVFRKASADLFEQYVKQAEIKLKPEKLALYKDALFEYQVETHAHIIMGIAHNLDVMRCVDKKIYDDICQQYIYPHVGEANCKELMALTECCLQATGDRIMGSAKPQGYNGEKFVKVSQSVHECILAIKEALINTALPAELPALKK